MSSPQGNVKIDPKLFLVRFDWRIVDLESVLYTAAQALFVYDTRRVYSVSNGGFIAKVMFGFMLRQSATNWISDPPFRQYDTYGVKVKLAAEIHPV